MMSNRLFLVCACVLSITVWSGVVSAQAKSNSTDRIKKLNVEVEITESGQEIYHQFVELTADNDDSAKNISEITINYSVSTDYVEIMDARTLKAAGEVLEVKPEAIREELAPGSKDFSEFNDGHRKVIIFPDVNAGDSVTYRVKYTKIKPYFPGQLLAHSILSPTTHYDDVSVTIRAPRTQKLFFDSRILNVTRRLENNKNVVEARYVNVNPIKEDRGEISSLDRYPALFVTTFPDWETLSRAYAKTALPKIEVTPEITAKAAEIVKGAKNKREEVEKIYNWVTTEIRYISIQLGVGGIEPFAAPQTLANRYGDCKAQAVLVASLLKARGIEAELVLINGSLGYSLPKVATMAAFNHMIAYVPSLDLYVDTTPGTVRFGQLPVGDYGKPVLHVTDKGAEPTRTPLLPDGSTTTLTTQVVLAPDGVMTGTSVLEADGAFAYLLRGVGQSIIAAGLERAATRALDSIGLEGEGAFDPPAAPRLLTHEYRVSGQFVLDVRPEIIEGEAFAIPVGYRLLPRPGDMVNGDIDNRTLPEEPTPCWPGRQTTIQKITLPEGWKLEKLPKGRKLEGAGVEFLARWEEKDGTVTVRRDYISRTPGPLCSGAQRAEIAKLQNLIRADYRKRIALVPPEQ